MFNRIRRILDENRSSHDANQKYLKELEWASIFHDSIRGKEWLEKTPVNIGRWAGNYSLFYLLNRILNDFKPKRILEFGLGQSSIFISAYLTNELYDTSHIILENEENWIDHFESLYQLNNNCKIIKLPLEQRSIHGYNNELYKNINSVLENAYDLYLVDGPKGSDSFSRYDMVAIANSLEPLDEFIIIIDDYERKGEKESCKELMDVLRNKGIHFIFRAYRGKNDQILICSPKYQYALSL